MSHFEKNIKRFGPTVWEGLRAVSSDMSHERTLTARTECFLS